MLDVRQIDVALRGLRRLGREGAHEELDLDETIDETCKNAGELEIVFRPPRRNRVKVLLLMDVGGSMDPHAELVSRLFTAASRTGRFAKFRSYYFHNCVYDSVYEDAQFRKGVPVADLLANSDRDEKLVVVGDALMHPAELLDPGGSLYLYSQNRARRASSGCAGSAHHFRSAAWLNPEPDRFWAGTTIEVIASVLPMWPLTLDGLGRTRCATSSAAASARVSAPASGCAPQVSGSASLARRSEALFRHGFLVKSGSGSPLPAFAASPPVLAEPGLAPLPEPVLGGSGVVTAEPEPAPAPEPAAALPAAEPVSADPLPVLGVLTGPVGWPLPLGLSMTITASLTSSVATRRASSSVNRLVSRIWSTGL